MTKIQPRPGLPANAQLVFKGTIFEIWQWPQKMFDGSTKIFEKAWRFPGLEIVATLGDKIIIEEEDQPDHKNTINLPSGRADHSNNILKEAKRELLEETGCVSDNWTLFYKHGEEYRVMHEVYYYLARDCRQVQEQQLDAGGEKIKIKLITFEEFLNLPQEPRFCAAPNFINYLLKLKNDKQKMKEFKNLLFIKPV